MARQEQIVIQSRFGEQIVEKDKIIYFPRGIIGFENMHEFTLLKIHPNTPMLILQSLDEPALGLFVADIYSFMSKYVLKIGDAEQKMLCLDSVQDATILVTVSIPTGKPHQTSLNLTGPIVVNASKRIGMQVPQSDLKQTHALVSELMAIQEAEREEELRKSQENSANQENSENQENQNNQKLSDSTNNTDEKKSARRIYTDK